MPGFKKLILRPKWISCLGIIACSAIFLLPYLATEAQNPDGLEILMAIKYNTLLHPPGNPIYLAISKIIGHFWPKIVVISWLSWIYFTAAAVILFYTAHHLTKSYLMATWTTLLFLAYPAAASLGTSPEKYAFLYLILIIFFYCFLQQNFLGVCIGLGLMAAHHDSFVLLLLPLPLTYAFIKSRTQLMKGILLALIIPLLAYSSLFLAASFPLWPNFGPLHSWQDLWTYLSFRNFGQNTDLSWRNFLHVFQHPFFKSWWRDGLQAWTVVGLIFLGLGIYPGRPFSKVSPQRSTRRFCLALTVYFVGGMLLLSLGNLNLDDYGQGYLSRYHTILLIPVLLLMAQGFARAKTILAKWGKWLSKRFKIRDAFLHLGGRTLLAIIFLIPVMTYVSTREILQGQKNQILTTWQNLLAAEISPAHVWAEINDYLTFGGIPVAKSPDTLLPVPLKPDAAWRLPHRFPLFPGLSIPLQPLARAASLDPRFTIAIPALAAKDYTFIELLAYFHQQGVSWQTTEESFILHFPHYRQGLSYIVPPSTTKAQEFAQYSTLPHYLQIAHRLCQGLQNMQGAVPVEQAYFQKIILKSWRHFFVEFHHLLKTKFKEDPSAEALGVITGKLFITLNPGITPTTWHQFCQELKID